MNYSRLNSFNSKDVTILKRNPKYKTGNRFGPRLAKDGGPIFQVSTFDITKMIEKRGFESHELDDLYDRGIMTKWLKIRGKRKTRVVLHDPVTGWLRGESKRTGLVGVKLGMSTELDMWGRPFPVTLIQFRENYVVQVKTDKTEPEKEGYCALQVGAGLKKLKRVSKAMAGHFAKAGVPPMQKIVEFKVSPDAVIDAGTRLHVSHFIVGQYVDIKGKSKGKGFAGVMKKHGFSGTFASHGVSVAHRGAGAIGHSSTPGKIEKGHPMAGRMGGNMTMTRNLQILKINNESEIMWVKGSVQGPKGSYVYVKDSFKSPHRLPPPFPTAPIRKNLPIYKRMKFFDPFFARRHTDWVAKWEEAKLQLKEKSVMDEDEEGDILGTGTPSTPDKK
jgi:large subunit ribosomal protein L3